MASPFLSAEWQHLIMANYIVDPAVLMPYLPNKTELDSYNDKMYISLVGFMFTNTRIMGLKIPWHVNFEEVNLRFYVRYNDKGQLKRGTVFIKEIVPKSAISFIANTIYHENYCTKRMKHSLDIAPGELKAVYQWKHRSYWNAMEVVADDVAVPMPAGSEQAFIAEHYWGYSRYNADTTYEYNVQHPAWEIYPLKKHVINCDFASLYGSGFSFLNGNAPNSVFLCKGSPVSVFKKRKL